MPGETSGILRKVEHWQPSSIGSIAMGQEVGVTPLQMAAAFGALANDGVRIAPHLVREVRNSSGAVVYTAQPEERRVVSAETAIALRGMGDVGSLAIGGAMGTVAVLTKQEFMLLMVGGVFVIEATSVMLQVGVFKMTKRTTGTGRRLFKMTPLHHHFEMQDWKESKIVFRFLILAILFALLSLSTLKLR